MGENTINVKSVSEIWEIIRNQAGEEKLLTITIDTEPQSEGNGASDRTLVMGADDLEEAEGELSYGDEKSLGAGSDTSRSDISCEGDYFEPEVLEGDRADG